MIPTNSLHLKSWGQRRRQILQLLYVMVPPRSLVCANRVNGGSHPNWLPKCQHSYWMYLVLDFSKSSDIVFFITPTSPFLSFSILLYIVRLACWMSYDIRNNQILNKMLQWIMKYLLLQNNVELEAFTTYYFPFFQASIRLFEPQLLF